VIIFDYSGTLSLEAPLFAAPEVLMEHLKAAGLHDFGIDSPSMFWERLVNPTWMEGSTTTAGYKKVLLERMAALHPNMPAYRHIGLAAAVAAFVDRYLSHSCIDTRWQPVLSRFSARPSARAVIATDHYAEATGAIIRFLGDWQIRAVPSAEAASNPMVGLVVANSADLGVHKADRRFWRILQPRLGIDARHILIVDDFGHNEQGADDYSRRTRVEARIKETALTLETVFSATVEVFPFMIGADAPDRNARIQTLIADATAAVERHLAQHPL
jgi:hypothetical protein